jgi:hypothetical protein
VSGSRSRCWKTNPCEKRVVEAGLRDAALDFLGPVWRAEPLA